MCANAISWEISMVSLVRHVGMLVLGILLVRRSVFLVLRFTHVAQAIQRVSVPCFPSHQVDQGLRLKMVSHLVSLVSLPPAWWTLYWGSGDQEIRPNCIEDPMKRE